MSDQPNDQRDPEPRNALTENATETPQPVERQQVDLAQRVGVERDTKVDLELCNAATPGPWQTAAMNILDGAYIYGPQPPAKPQIPGLMRAIPPITLCWEDAQFIAAAREALPWYIQAYLAERAEVERLRVEYRECGIERANYNVENHRLKEENKRLVEGIHHDVPNPSDIETAMRGWRRAHALLKIQRDRMVAMLELDLLHMREEARLEAEVREARAEVARLKQIISNMEEDL